MNSPRFPSQIVHNDESALVASAQGGNPAAFEELVRRYQSKILRLTFMITRNQEDAEDGTQEAFLKAFTHLPGFRGNSRFYTWLVRIAINEALLQLRQRRRCPRQISLDEPIEGDSGPVLRELADWRPNPEERFASAEIRNILDDLLDQLKPKYGIVLVLRDLEELSIQETASVLALSVSSVKTRLLRARLGLRKELIPHLRLSD
jgi:RNA polymerase sigma-70 factor (ECF subfamily)